MTNDNKTISTPQQTILTTDLILRPLQLADAENYFALYSDPDVMKGWGTPVHQTVDETRNLILSLFSQTDSGELIRWGIFEKNFPDQLVGDVGYWRFVRVRHRGELGAKLSKKYWNKGWMTQALSAVIEYGFTSLHLHSVEGNIAPSNFGSHRLVEKIGFQKIGVIPEHSYDPLTQTYLDTVLYSLTKSQWKGFPCEII